MSIFYSNYSFLGDAIQLKPVTVFFCHVMQPNVKVGAVAFIGIIILIIGCVLGWYGFPVIIDSMLAKVSGKVKDLVRDHLDL